jgi:hypothetical protein
VNLCPIRSLVKYSAHHPQICRHARAQASVGLPVMFMKFAIRTKIICIVSILLLALAGFGAPGRQQHAGDER